MRVEAVKNGPEHRVNRSKFHQTTRTPPNVNFIRKVNGSWMSWVNPILLKAGFGKDQHLARFRDSQRPQETPNNLPFVALQPNLPRGEPGLERANCVLGRRTGVRD